MNDFNSNKNSLYKQLNHQLIKSISAQYITNYSNCSKQRNIKPLKNGKTSDINLISKSIKYSGRRHRSALKEISLINNDYSTKINFKKNSKNIIPDKIILDRLDSNRIDLLSSQIQQNSPNFYKKKFRKITQEDNVSKIYFKNGIRSFNSKNSTNISSTHDDNKPVKRYKIIKMTNKSTIEKVVEHKDICSYSKMAKLKLRRNDNKNDTLRQYSSSTSSLKVNNNKENQLFSLYKIPVSSSNDFSSKKGQFFNNALLNESCAISSSSLSCLLNPNKMNANFIDTEDVHFKFVEIYQEKKRFYMNLSQSQGNDYKDIENCYLDQE